MKKSILAAIVLCSILAVSCIHEVCGDIESPAYGYGFCNREVKAVDLTVIRKEMGDVNENGNIVRKPIPVMVEEGESVSGSNLYIDAYIRGKERPQDTKFYYFMLYRIPGNKVIEDQLRTLATSLAPELEGNYAPMDTDCYGGVEYRTEACKAITINSSSPMFGMDSDCDVTDRFRLSSEFMIYPVFSSENYRMLGRIEEGMTIDEYLALKPFVNANLLFQLSEIPENLPLSTSFTVDIELADGRHISSTTPAVTIE